MSESDRIFPLVDRRAPLLERIRNARNGEESKLGVKLGNQVAEMVGADDELREMQTKLVAQDFRKTLAERFDTEPENINDDLVNEVAAMFGALQKDDILDNTDDDTGTVSEDEEEREEDGEEVSFGDGE